MEPSTRASGAHHPADAGRASPVVLRVLARVHHPPANVLVVRSSADARALDARGYRVTEVGSGFLGATWPEPFDLICEAGLYTELSPEDRDRYVLAAGRALRPGGQLFGGFAEGPGAGSASDLIHRFSPAFEVDRLEPTGFAAEIEGRTTLEVVLKRR